MAQKNGRNLDTYYTNLTRTGNLRTPAHARRWSKAVLWTLGLNLGRGAKKKLAQALPDELAHDLTRAFWLLNFRNTNLPQQEFLKNVAKRSGHTDAVFARQPTQAVFSEMQQLIDKEINDQVGKALAPEIRALWEQAGE